MGDGAASRPHVLVVGAGFAGVALARGLAGVPVDVTIVDQHNYNTFQPLLYQVATSGLNAADVAFAVRGIFQRQPNVDFRQATVTGVDWEQRRLLVDDDAGIPAGASRELAFDYLALAAGGATTNFFGVDGAADHAFPLYGLTDAIRLRNHVLACFESADADPSLVDDGALTFVVVGGGPTGVEVAGALAELFSMVLRKDFRHLDVGKARVVLVEMLGYILPPFGEPSRRHRAASLERRGVEVRVGESVTAVSETRVQLASGEELAAHTLIWAAGVQANPLAHLLGVETTRGGRIVVEPDLRVPGRLGVFAIGDIAAVVDTRRGVVPQLAPVAMQSGRHAARQIRRTLDGRPGQPFRYRDKGTMATIGRHSAVAELPLGIHLRATPAWLAWLGLHLLYLIGFRNRLSVLVNWAWNWLTWDRGPRLIIGARPDAPSATPPGDPTRRR